MLEDRALLSGTYYPNFATDVSAKLSGPLGVQELVSGLFDNSNEPLPLLGSAAALNQLACTQFINEAGIAIAGMDTFFNNAQELDQKLELLFGSGTVTVVQPPRGLGIYVDILLTDSFTESTNQIFLDTGLDGLPFSFDTKGSIDFTVQYDHYLSFYYAGLPQSFGLVDTGQSPDSTITLEASLANFEAVAKIGFLEAEVTDNGSSLNMTFEVDDLHTTPSLSFGGIGATLDLHVVTGAGPLDYGDSFPTIETDFFMDWDFSTPGSPDVWLKNMELGFEGILGGALEPLVAFVQPILEPIQPVIDIAMEPIPVLTELNNMIGGGNVTLLSLAGLAGNALPPGYEELLDLGVFMVQIADLIDMFDVDDADGLVLELGDFQVNDLASGGDLLGLGAAESSMNTVVTTLQGGFTFTPGQGLNIEGIKTQVESWNLPAGIEDGITGVLDRLNSGIEYSFPILDDPVYAAVSLLMGNEFDIFRFQGQAIGLQSEPPGGDFTLPIGLEIGFGGGIAIDAIVKAGYDTYGIRKFLNSGAPEDILEGFYLMDDTKFHIGGTINAYAGVDTMFFDAGVIGGVKATLGVDMTGLDIDNQPLNHKVRRTENDTLFNVTGRLSAYLNAYVQIGVEVFGEFIGHREEFNLVDETLWSFNSDTIHNPFIPVDTLHLAGDYDANDPGNPANTVRPIDSDHPNVLDVLEPNGVLTLNVGPDGNKRHVTAKPGVTSESYYIYSKLDEDNNEVIVVSAFGFTQSFYGVQKIVGDAGTDNDTIVVAEGVNVPVELRGGSGNDELKYLGGGQAILYGDDDNDLLESGTGDDNRLYGGIGDDVLKGGTILVGAPLYTNRLEGGDGEDTLYAGQGFNNNLLYGDGDNDSLFASDYGDVLYGGGGDDFLQTGAGIGPFGDYVICGAGDDRVTWEVGSQTAHVYGNLNTLIPNAYDRGYDSVGIKGTTDADVFEVADLTLGEIAHWVEVVHQGTGHGVLLAQVEGVSIEALQGADTITVHDLADTSIQDVGINLGDIIDVDNAEDQIFVEGTAGADTVVVQLEGAGLYPVPPKGDQILGGITLIDIVPHYQVRMANVNDHVELTTFAGEDQVDVHGISGPTWIDTAGGGDQLHVIDNATQFSFITGDSDFLAQLQIDAGLGANTMFFMVDGAPQVMQETVHLTDQTLTAEHLIPEGVIFTATGGSYGGGIWLDTGYADDTVYVQNTLPNVNTLVTTGHGADTIRLSSNATMQGNLSTIEGPIKVDAGPGGNYLELADYGAIVGNALVQILSMSVHGLAGPTDNIDVLYAASGGTYQQIRIDTSNKPAVTETFRIDKPNGPLYLSTHDGNETIDVESTFFYTEIFAGKGDDVVNVGEANSLDTIYGPIAFFGKGGTDTMNVNDQNSTNGTNYTLTSGSLHRLNAGLIMFDKKLEYLNVNMTRHGDAAVIVDVPKDTAVLLKDFGGDDYLFGPDMATVFEISSENAGSVNGSLAFSVIENLIGGNKQDRFAFVVVDGASFANSISGGGGKDTLDYSGMTDPVMVDFSANKASYVGSVVDVEHAIGGPRDDVLIGNASKNDLSGGPGNDILLGNAEKDGLFGGLGRDVLIGGADMDKLSGDEDDDILIGGSTVYDANILALLDILAEWSRGDLGYAGRIDHLRSGGGLNGTTVLDSTTVSDDAAKDTLQGNVGLDWFFAKLANPKKDKLPDYTTGSGEEVDWL